MYHSKVQNLAKMMQLVLIGRNQDMYVGLVKIEKNHYKIASYQMYESQIRSQTKCNFCSTEVSHNAPDGKAHCSAHIEPRP